MKTLLASLACAVLLSTVACAAPTDTTPAESSASDLKKGGGVKFADFASDAKEMASHMDQGDDCSFGISAKGSSLTLTVTESGKTTEIEVSSKDAVTKSEKDDGSTRIYKIKGVGTVTFITADDAFISAAVTSTATKTTSTCEIDF